MSSRAACVCVPAGLDQWERELGLFMRLKQLKLFKLYKLWKGFRVWKRAVNNHKFTKAKASLQKNLFMLSPVFQSPMHRFHALCFELSAMRLHKLEAGKVGPMARRPPLPDMLASMLDWFARPVG